jgi:hypothetical protein
MNRKQLVMKADAPESERDEANLLKSEMQAQYTEAKRSKANPTKSRGRAYLKAEYKRGQQVLPTPIEERANYRAKILSYVLFPNLFNREAVMKYQGAS